jgi:hypothetical protein
MKTSKSVGIFVALALAFLAAASAAAALPAYIDSAKVNDQELVPNDWTRLDMQRTDKLELELQLSALEQVSDVQVQAFISGYEYNTGDSRIEADSANFDMEPNVTYVKRLSFTIPGDIAQDDYKLRIVVSDRNSDAIVEDYNLKIEGFRHAINIADVILSDSVVKQGGALLAIVRVENWGQLTESNVKVTASVPELGLSASDFVDEIKVDKQKDSQELYLRVPTCAKAGVYKLNIEAAYNRGHDTVKASAPFEVIESGSCAIKHVVPQPVQPASIVVVQQPTVPAENTTAPVSSGLKSALEITLLVLIGLLVIVGIVLGLTRLRSDEDEE